MKIEWLMWFLENAVSVICFCALAAFFGKWWIALFAIFFQSSLKTEKGEKRANAGTQFEEDPTDH